MVGEIAAQTGTTHSWVHPIVWTSIIMRLHTAQIAATQMTSVGCASRNVSSHILAIASLRMFFSGDFTSALGAVFAHGMSVYK